MISEYFFRKSVKKIQVSLKSAYFAWRRFHMYDNISLNSSYNENVSDKSCRENRNTYFMFNNFFFFENRVGFEIMSKNVMEQKGQKWRHSVPYMRCMVGNQVYSRTHECAHTHTHTQTYNTYCFFMAIMIRESASVLRYTHIACLFFVIWFTSCAVNIKSKYLKGREVFFSFSKRYCNKNLRV